MASSDLSRIRQRREYLTGSLFVLPAIVFLVLFIAYPVIQSLLLSFFDWDGVGPWSFAGFKNYVRMFTRDRYFFKALKNTILFTILMMAGEITLGFIYSILVDLGIRGWKAFRFIFFMPVCLSQVAISLLWVKIFQEEGLLNALLGVLGLDQLRNIWLGDVRFAMWCIIFVSWWQWGGWHMVFFLAGMQAIDPQIYESAKMDGATTPRRVFSITIPLLKNVWFILIILCLINGFKMFDLVYIMTTGGPAAATEVLGTQLYQHAFDVHKYGLASVLAVIMVVASLILSVFYVRVTGYREEALGE
jgi:ABC-type sugar transport system permease subunit